VDAAEAHAVKYIVSSMLKVIALIASLLLIDNEQFE